MSHTNSTTNYSLPQFVTTDKPAWLTDINGAFSAIDTGMNNAQTKANTADTNASQALLDASAASTAASTADAKGAGAVASLADTFQTTETYALGDLIIYNNLLYVCTTAVDVPGAWTGSTNWSRITVEGAISNEVSDLETSISNKADKNGSSVSISAVTDVSTILNGGTKRIGNLICLCTEFRLTNSVSANDRILSIGLSANYPAAQSFICAIKSAGNTYKLTANTDGAIRAGYSMPADSYILMGFWTTN